MAHLLPNPKMQFTDINGDPLSGGKVNTYEAGTSTRKATYTTAAASVANANPVILDSRGEANIFWSTGSYKIVLTDSDDAEIYTVDNITLSATGAAGASFRAGSGVPSDSLGSDGDRYLRTDTGQIYLKGSGVYSVESTMALPASAVVNTPSGNLAADDVQEALNELQTELDAATAHISDSSDAHDASAISSTPSGNLAADDVQEALNELQTELDAATAHISDSADAHAASAITNTPSGNLAATNVQTALNELQTEIDTLGDFDSISPMTAEGDIIYGGASGTGTRLAKGSDGQVLKLASGVPTWSADNTGSAATVRAVTSTDDTEDTDNVVVLSGASFTLTLHTAVGNTGQILDLLHNGTSFTQVYTLATTSAQTIGGVASGSYALYTNGEKLRLVSDGSNWLILSHITDTGWLAYTPTYTGMGTPAASTAFYKRVGDTVFVQGVVTAGTVTADQFSITLPGGSSFDTAKIITNSDIRGLAMGPNTTTGTAIPASTRGPYPVIVRTAQATVVLVADNVDADNDIFNTHEGNSIAGSGTKVPFHFNVPIAGWQP